MRSLSMAHTQFRQEWSCFSFNTHRRNVCFNFVFLIVIVWKTELFFTWFDKWKGEYLRIIEWALKTEWRRNCVDVRQNFRQFRWMLLFFSVVLVYLCSRCLTCTVFGWPRISIRDPRIEHSQKQHLHLKPSKTIPKFCQISAKFRRRNFRRRNQIGSMNSTNIVNPSECVQIRKLIYSFKFQLWNRVVERFLFKKSVLCVGRQKLTTRTRCVNGSEIENKAKIFLATTKQRDTEQKKMKNFICCSMSSEFSFTSSIFFIYIHLTKEKMKRKKNPHTHTPIGLSKTKSDIHLIPNLYTILQLNRKENAFNELRESKFLSREWIYFGCAKRWE